MITFEKIVASPKEPLTNVLWVDTTKKILKYFGPNGWCSLTSARLSDMQNDVGYQTEDDVKTAIQNLVGSAPEALDTLKELADALGNDADFATTITEKLNTLQSTIDKQGAKLEGIEEKANNYVLPAATDEALGGIKTGYEKNGTKYPVELDENNKAYVNVDIDYLDLVSYGVSWIAGQSDPTLNRIGNLAYHKSLPIQSQMRGCIAQPTADKPIQYYLNADDWRWKEDPTTVSNVSLVVTTTTTEATDDTEATTTTTYTITNADYFGTLQYEKMWIKLGTVECQVYSIDVATTTATIIPKSDLETGTYVMELGSVRNGYDGFVCVDVPEFYIKSWDGATGEEQSVRISQINPDGTWEHQPRMLVNAYKSGILRSVPTDMGYLSTLSANAAICVVNEHDYCRGGNNSADYDSYVESDPCTSNLNKPATDFKYSNYAITYSRISNQENMSYNQYKNLVWLVYIEYASFYTQDEFNAELTEEGYRQGGLGAGITNVSTRTNDHGAITPNGYNDELGNHTGVKLIKSSTITPTDEIYDCSYRGILNIFADIYEFKAGVITTERYKTAYGLTPLRRF